MNIQIRITKKTVRKSEQMMDTARLTCDSLTLRRIMAVPAVIDGYKFSLIASVLKVCDESVRIWVKKFLLKGPAGLKSGKPTGRKPKLTKKQKNAFILFGDESSFPQWGSLSYTRREKGVQPVVKTPGNRKSYKICGLIDYFTGRFFFKGHEGRLNSDSYIAFLKEVLSKTRKHIILIQDGASYHRSRTVKDFLKKRSARLTVYRLPSYSPDYNPIEKLFEIKREKDVHLHYFPTFESLKNRVGEGLLRFNDLKKEILSLFVFYNKLLGEYSG